MSDEEGKKEYKPRIDPDLPPNNPTNVEIRRRLGWRYDSRRRIYRNLTVR